MKEEDGSGNVRLERQFRLTLTEDEYKTIVTALHDYGHYCLDAADSLSQMQIRIKDGVDYAHGAALAKVCGDRAFGLKGRISGLWEEA
jgi:hypothetical protein